MNNDDPNNHRNNTGGMMSKPNTISTINKKAQNDERGYNIANGTDFELTRREGAAEGAGGGGRERERTKNMNNCHYHHHNRGNHNQDHSGVNYCTCTFENKIMILY